jgi:hypothetical protein
MEHILLGPNQGLVLPRRMETAGPWQHCLSTREIVDHVAVSSKTIDYLFPLYLYPSEGGLFERDDAGSAGFQPAPSVSPTSRSDNPVNPTSPSATRRPNLHPDFLRECERRLSLHFLPNGRATGFQPVVPEHVTFGPEDVFNYIYALLHCPTYRTRYAEFLKRDFPRIPLTSDRALFASLVSKGRDLVALHLLESPLLADLSPGFPARGSNVVERVQYNANEQSVYLNKERQHFTDVPTDVWRFHVGGYQVCDKWLKDRKGRTLSYDDLLHYRKIVVSLRETLRLMSEIDALLPTWPLL